MLNRKTERATPDFSRDSCDIYLTKKYNKDRLSYEDFSLILNFHDGGNGDRPLKII